MTRRRSVAIGFGVSSALSLLLAASPSRAAVPAGYMGKPHGGTPKAIPGRVNLVDYDDGGDKVAFDVDHNGDVGCAGYDYRMDKPTPVLCKTSAQEGDKYTAGPMMGMKFPSATTDDYYIGAVRPGDWVQVTVNVQQTGTYLVSTDWASDAGMIDVKVSFNGVEKLAIKRAGTGGYHNWVPAPNFAMVQLEAGDQVMRFQSVVEHMNMNYLQFTLMGGAATGAAGAGAAGAGAAGAGAAGAGAAGAGAAGAGAAGTGAAGSATGAAGSATGAAGSTTGAAGSTTGAAGSTTGAAGSTTGAAGSTTGAAGTGATTGAAGTTGSGTGAAGTGSQRGGGGGCAVVATRETDGGALLFLSTLAASLVLTRRRRR
jgi:hypothetical protein